MDYSTVSWFSELGTENSIFEDRCDFTDSFDEDLAAFLGEESPTLSPRSNCSSSLIRSSSSSTNLRTSSCMEKNEVAIEQPSKQKETNNYNFCRPNPDPFPSSSTPIILNFGSVNSFESPQPLNLSTMNSEEKAAVSEVLRKPVEVTKIEPTKKKTSRVRPPSQTYDHILAERKRREHLSQQFVALSALVPGLKRRDKNSVLGDAIKYLKHLQQRMQAIEEQSTKQNLESVVLVKRSRLLMEDDGLSYESNSSSEQQLPEIEARVCNNDIHLRIHIKKHKGVLSKVLCEVEKLNLTIVNINVTPFGSFAHDIIIIAEMEEESSLTAKEIVKILDSTLHRTA
ncbi:transcription factor bHLH18-like [Olea europaea subsp. europaea]|uniref:Transcription factor bHLH18-like n=1 Tax=Olea europaea subsp. europaea TaxID=158383 RepID=A0A8S0PXI4_OLEEU|nr:transcription factor bHLH18-like [Olea europaea subsp. europaea]